MSLIALVTPDPNGPSTIDKPEFKHELTIGFDDSSGSERNELHLDG